MSANIIYAILVTSLATFLSRFLGVISSQGIKETSKLFRWFNCLAYATLSALIARTIIFPAGVLVDSTYSSRLIVVLLSLLVFFISNKNYIYPTIFSAICMAKALMDSGIDGTVHTFDPIPHTKKVYWNSITDHQEGKLTREELLTEWGGLIEQYIVFHNGFSKFLLPKIHVGRINFAFLDASRRYKDVVFDLDMVKKHQKRGDIIIVDDYNKVQFSGVVKAVDQLCAAGSYEKRILNSFSARSYAVLKRLY